MVERMIDSYYLFQTECIRKFSFVIIKEVKLKLSRQRKISSVRHSRINIILEKMTEFSLKQL